jgi:hypothetical protein
VNATPRTVRLAPSLSSIVWFGWEGSRGRSSSEFNIKWGLYLIDVDQN